MQTTEIQQHARKMLDTFGPQAIVEAAQKTAEHERQGNKQEARNWRRIYSALRIMRGPHQS